MTKGKDSLLAVRAVFERPWHLYRTHCLRAKRRKITETRLKKERTEKHPLSEILTENDNLSDMLRP